MAKWGQEITLPESSESKVPCAKRMLGGRRGGAMARAQKCLTAWYGRGALGRSVLPNVECVVQSGRRGWATQVACAVPRR